MISVSNHSAVRPDNSSSQGNYENTLNTVAAKLSDSLEQSIKKGKNEMIPFTSQLVKNDVNHLAKEYISGHIGEIINKHRDKDSVVKDFTDAIKKDLRSDINRIMNSRKQDCKKGLDIFDQMMKYQKGEEALKAIVGNAYDQLKKPVLYGPDGAESGGVVPG